MSLGFRKFISEMFMNGKFPKILPSENFPLYGTYETDPNNTFQALYEVELRCGNSSAMFAGASLLDNFPTLSNTLVLTVRSPDIENIHSGRVCVYNISDINTAMDNGRIACASGESRETVWNDYPSDPLIYQAVCHIATVSVLFTHLFYAYT